MILNRTQILEVPLKQEVVDVPEWGDGAQVVVQEMTAIDRFHLSADLAEVGGEEDTIATISKVLARCLVDADGNRLFADDDAPALGKKSAVCVERLFAVAQRLNGMSATFDDAGKKSEPSPSEPLPFVSA